MGKGTGYSQGFGEGVQGVVEKLKDSNCNSITTFVRGTVVLKGEGCKGTNPYVTAFYSKLDRTSRLLFFIHHQLAFRLVESQSLVLLTSRSVQSGEAVPLFFQ